MQGVVMSTEKALEHAEEWTRGQTFYAGMEGWRVVCATLAEEVKRLRRGEFICQKCGIRKNSDHVHGDF